MIHPARTHIEKLHASGACPRIKIDMRDEGVVCPDFVREQYEDSLIIDLDPSYPLDLGFTDTAVEADISFDGFVTRCTFPFRAIRLVIDRGTGKGIRLDAGGGATDGPVNYDEEIALAAERLKQRASGRKDKGRSHRRRRAKAKPEQAPQPVKAPQAVDDGADGSPTTSEEDVKRRRAGFQVIDGDG